MAQQIEELDDWGLIQEIHCYRDIDTHLYETRRKIEELENSLVLLKGQQTHCHYRLNEAHITDHLPNLEMLTRNSEGVCKQYGRCTQALPHHTTWAD